jgi:hypothetical protein
MAREEWAVTGWLKLRVLPLGKGEIQRGLIDPS